MQMSTFVLLESGAFQAEHVLNGIAVLQERLWQVLPKENVLRRRWTAPALGLADQLRKRYEPGDRILLAGHSKGGASVNDVAWGLSHFGVPVHAEFLCDAFGDKLGRCPVVVPANVANVWVYVSEKNVIEGSRVKLTDPDKTAKFAYLPFDVAHPKMSLLPVFHADVLRVAAE